MSDEIPEANPPMREYERAVAARLTAPELHDIDAAIIASCRPRWNKLAIVVSRTTDAIGRRFPDLSDRFYCERIAELVDQGNLEAQGDLRYMRFSEVRLPSRADEPIAP